jgi:adenylate kinase family enzyme/YHS domain-containing protein
MKKLKKIIPEYFTINNIIDIDCSQPLENILHCLQKKVTVQGHFQYGRNVLPERVIIANQSVLDDPNEDNQIEYILAQEPETEVEMPKRKLSVWGKYCCVTYTETKELVIGSPLYSAIYHNYLYLFVSENALIKFMKNPILYFQYEPIIPITKMCIIGPRYSGQTSISKLLAKQYNLQNINIEEILQCISHYVVPKESNEKLSISTEDNLYQKVKDICDQGLEVTSEMMVDIIKYTLKKNEENNYRGWIIEGFPSTVEQAQLLLEENLIPDNVIFLKYDIQTEEIMERITNIKVNALTGIEWNPVITGNTKSPRKVSLKIPENYKIQACPFIEETFESYKKEEAEIINFLNENNIPQTTVESERDIAAMFHQVRCEIDQFFPRALQNTINSENIEYGYTKDYCPVMLKNNNVLVKSSNTYSLEYQNRIYNFLNEECKNDFMANPYNYIGHSLPKPPPPRIFITGISGSGKTTIFKNIPIGNVHYIEFKKFVTEVFAPTLPPEEQKEYVNSIFESHNSMETNPNVENYILNIMKKLYTEEPYVSDGFILENFPRTSLEAQTLINNNYVADMVIYLKIETEQAVTRLLPGRIKMEEEKFKQRTLNKNIKDPKKSDESDESGESGGIEDDESEKDEFPENPEEFYSDELNEECEKESGRINEIISAIESFSLIPINEVEAGRCLRPIIYRIKKLLRPYIQYHESILTHTIPIDNATADVYIEKGIKKLSKFGKTCPVTLTRNKYQNKKTIGRLPVIYNDYIIYLRSRSCQKEFEMNTYYYMNQPEPEPIVKPQIIVTGLPMSGKTTLASSLAKLLHAEYLTIPTIIQDLVDANEQTDLVQKIKKYLYYGYELPDDLIVKALKVTLLRTRCLGRGWVLDNFPLNINQAELMVKYDIIPQLVVEIQIQEEEVYRRGKEIINQNRSEEFCTINVPEGLEFRIMNYIQNYERIKEIFDVGYNSWFSIDGMKSKWAIKDMVYKTVIDYSLKEQNYLNQKNNKHAAPIYHVRMNTELINRNIGKFREYCPVCYIDNEELVKGDPGTQFVAEYQNKFYRMAGERELKQFLLNPERYVNSERNLPEILPKQLYVNSLKSIFPKSFELKGYCPVTFAEGTPDNFDSIIVGDLRYVVEYDDKLYCMANEKQLDKFMRTPWKYINYILPKKLPPKKLNISISKLPMIGYMEQTLSTTIYQSIEAIGKERPVYPYRSLEFSAARFLGLYLKANNVNATRFSREVNERKLKKFIEECELTKEVYNTVKEQLKLEKEKQGEKRDGEGEGEGEREDKKNKNYNLILSLKEKEGLSEKVDRIISLKN